MTAARLPSLDSSDPGHQQISYANAVNRIRAQLAEPDMPVEFVVAAEERLLSAADELVGNLGVEAVKIAGEDRATVVDRHHVNRAYDRATAKPSKLKELWWGLFGLCGGAAISFGTTAVTDPNHRLLWAVIAAISAVAAVVLLVVSIRSSK